ncbi:hypothetical protein AWC38_SpisGene21430 [Stylophora pistillata]|uniref:DEAD/DEAH-box helicase domain-containing protein n=1 Tax=Stylophora pistillata TaxID=50429 RepID=A0A2B4RC92_STYPI|nr:hypothetical protein AWC38_SpisGene21430 [Stylophora pistillata]
MEALKNNPIDHDTQQRLKEQAGIWKEMQEREKIDTTIFSPDSCLPDKISEESIFGRDQEIKQVRDMVQSGVPVVLITGGPGFGKTTVAKRVAHELAKLEKERTVLFCSLLTKTNFNEVAVEMINSCGTISTQVPENPGQWLKDWSKGVQNIVTFVLDNADGVLESNDRASFISILSDVRRISRQRITSPKNLCGRVPLALCIVGSLLSDYSEETLIESLEKEPLAVLEDDEKSVEKAIKTSFDLLKKPEQEVFVLISLFQGPFDLDAVQAVMKAECSISGSLPISILRSLRNRSLVEKPYSRRYQMHPLIQSYAKKIGQDKRDHLLAMGKTLACIHFMLRLARNADIYWSKNTCKDSLVSFQQDSYNFEYFLQIYAQGREEQDPEIVNGCEPFLDSFPQKWMYLERCLLPQSYTNILERLLKTFHSCIQPVHTVDLLCLLGHEYRKKGKEERYKEVMDEAEKIILENAAVFQTYPLSEVYFHNSYARFFSDKKDPSKNEKREEETEMALKVSYERLGKMHPETAATLYLSGIIAKRSKKPEKSEQQLRKALIIFQDCLGTHFMTAETLKAIADSYFYLEGKTGQYSDKSLEYYQKAVEMLEELGAGGSKEVILTLKNFGMCHMKRHHFKGAMDLLTKAQQVANREIEGIHRWKVWIKTALAILHDKMGKQDRAIQEMQEGLSMSKALNLTIDWMGDKNGILDFIERHPKEFPKTNFPIEWAMKMNSPTDIGKLALDEEGINQKIKEKVVIVLVFSSGRDKKIKMAERRDTVLREACDHLSNNLKFTLQLKPEQRNAVDYLLKRDDVLAVLPTGYGKSLIFQLFAVAVSIEGEERQTVLVICALKSITEDQIAEAGSIGISAASTEDISEDELRAAKFRLSAAKFRTDGYHLRKYKSYPDDHSVPVPKSAKLDRNKRSATRCNTAISIPQSFASTELAAVPTESSASHNEETIVQEKEAIMVR